VTGRQRASQARDAFARVGKAPAGGGASDTAIVSAGGNGSGKADQPAGRHTGRKAGRRVGRPAGPQRRPLTVRILAVTDERLTAAVEVTGKSPQYIVDAALADYLDRIGI